MERVRIALPFLLTALFCASAQLQPNLVFDHKIGTEWKPESNGSTVAADVPHVESGGTGFWTGKAGRYTAKSPRGSEYSYAEFNQAGQYVAVVRQPVTGKPQTGPITIIRTADGSVLAAFGSRYTASVAFHPDHS